MTLRIHPKQALFVLGGAGALGLFEAVQARLLLYRDIPDALCWPEALLRTLPRWLILGLLVPAISYVARKVPVRRETWHLAVPLQLLAAVLFALVDVALWTSFSAWRTQSPWLPAFQT